MQAFSVHIIILPSIIKINAVRQAYIDLGGLNLYIPPCISLIV